MSCIDAMARLLFGDIHVNVRFKRFARKQLRSFSAGDMATRFYEEIRNGLVHEARLKDGAQFVSEIDRTVEVSQGLLLVNPRLLADEVRSALDRYVDLIDRDRAERSKFARTLRQYHAKDLEAAQR